jgi:hypothetical protein
VALFRYGKQRERLAHMLVGGLMVVYPYMVTSVVPMLAVAGALIALLWAATRLGL